MSIYGDKDSEIIKWRTLTKKKEEEIEKLKKSVEDAIRRWSAIVDNRDKEIERLNKLIEDYVRKEVD
jgi:hypothetical protein